MQDNLWKEISEAEAISNQNFCYTLQIIIFGWCTKSSKQVSCRKNEQGSIAPFQMLEYKIRFMPWPFHKFMGLDLVLLIIFYTVTLINF